MNVDFKVKRTEDCVLIDTKKWLTDGSGISIHRMSGRDVPTGIAQVVCSYPEKKELEGITTEGDTVLISKVASDISQYRKFGVVRGDDRYFSCPIMQVLGVFRNKEFSINSLEMCTDKVLIEKVDVNLENLHLPKSNTMVGKVVKTGTYKFDKNWKKEALTTKIGDIVVVRDNVTTHVKLLEGDYYVTEESMIVGCFDPSAFTLENLEVRNNYIIMESYIPVKLNNTIITPYLNYEDEDMTEIYNRDLFKVLKKDEKIDKISENDIVLIDRNITNYVYIGSKRYFVTCGTDNIMCRIQRGGDNDTQF